MHFFGRRKGERRSIEILSTGTDRRDYTDRRSSVPRRKYERYKANDGIFVKIKNSVIKLGQVLDISKGGLSFHYIDIGRPTQKSLELEISKNNNGFHMHNLQLKSITDLDADKEYTFSSIPTRRLGGQFDNLSQDQIYQIENFIIHHTLGRV